MPAFDALLTVPAADALRTLFTLHARFTKHETPQMSAVYAIFK